MSMMPDSRNESYLEIPLGTQQDLYRSLKALQKLDGDLLTETGSRTTLWERNFEISEKGATLLSKIINDYLENNTTK